MNYLSIRHEHEYQQRSHQTNRCRRPSQNPRSRMTWLQSSMPSLRALPLNLKKITSYIPDGSNDVFRTLLGTSNVTAMLTLTLPLPELPETSAYPADDSFRTNASGLLWRGAEPPDCRDRRADTYLNEPPQSYQLEKCQWTRAWGGRGDVQDGSIGKLPSTDHRQWPLWTVFFFANHVEGADTDVYVSSRHSPLVFGRLSSDLSSQKSSSCLQNWQDRKSASTWTDRAPCGTCEKVIAAFTHKTRALKL